MKNLIDEVKISSRLEDISVVESKVETLKSSMGIDDSKFGNVMLAVVEAVTNAIQHGNRYAPDKEVTFETYHSPRELKFMISDEGEGFDPNRIPDPTLPENVENPCGRGVFLIKNLADEVVFRDEGRTIELQFNL
ncbi:MAG: ATP-binding protein [Bacteroidetes bacterium]|nr:ATP-binding protein [Bacteroidota bacterium]